MPANVCHCQLISTTYDVEAGLYKAVEEAVTAKEGDNDLEEWN